MSNPTRRKAPHVVYEDISPNRNSPRNQSIRRLTPHCMAGNLTMERCLNLTSFQAGGNVSVNYSIGSDGRVGLGVPETDRAWTSSSKTNDYEAITFEIANDGTGPDWHMSDDAINSWLDLAVDICQFYGYSKVNYVAKPANITIAQAETWIKTWAKPDEMIITLHRWFKAKDCPGAYFMRQIPWLVGEMNKRLQNPDRIAEIFVGEGAISASNKPTLKQGSAGASVVDAQTRLNLHGAHPMLEIDGKFGKNTHDAVISFQTCWNLVVNGVINANTWAALDKDPIVSPSEPQKENPKPASKSNEEIIWGFFKDRGLNDFAIAGIMGNLYAESYLRSDILQTSYSKSLGLSSEEYTKKVDDGTYKNFITDKAGYGLAQWTHSSRKQALMAYRDLVKTSIGDLKMQLDFLWKELKGYKALLSTLASTTSVYDAAVAFMMDFERPADQSTAARKKRSDLGQKYYEQFGHPETDGKQFVPYQATITASSLNVRTVPGTNGAVVGSLKKNNTVEIIQEVSGQGAAMWGLLSTRAGWISLDFVKKR